MQHEPYAVVIGGTNIDIGGRCLAPPVARDSNPATVRQSLGGVGRNIAHNLALLGVKVHLLTALGADAQARHIEESCQKLGIDLSHALHVPDGHTSTYLFIADDTGDMALAVSDMQICEKIDEPYLQKELALINGAAAVIVEANLPRSAVEFLAQRCTAPMFADPVSVAKAQVLCPLFGKLHTLKPNRMEAELLSGVKITDARSLREATLRLLENGAKRVFLSLGTQGVIAAEGGTMVHIPCFPAQMRNATGAGDSFTAALAWSFLQGASLQQSALAAAATAAITVESPLTVSDALSAEAVRARMRDNFVKIHTLEEAI